MGKTADFAKRIKAAGSCSQQGALCYRRKGNKVQVLMITSRTTRRWIIPKGWLVPGLSPAESAAREAWEEAGVQGSVAPVCIGIYAYDKIGEKGRPTLPCVVSVFPLEVSALARRYPESGQRRRRWVSPAKAATLVNEPELAQILADFAPHSVR